MRISKLPIKDHTNEYGRCAIEAYLKDHPEKAEVVHMVIG
jgi:hypothetical protein